MQIALGLGHLHSMNIIYRDLKPENVLIHEDGYMQITDYGISQTIDSTAGEIAYSRVGTNLYMAPEMHKAKESKQRGYDFAVDWWALGILIYELMIGCPPFDDENSH